MTVNPLGSCAHVPGGGGGGGGGGSTVTVMAAVPFCPSLVAVIVAEPTRRPVTNPLPLTVATSVLLLPHVTVRPVSTLPLASRNVAVSCRSEEHTSELQSQFHLVCRLLLEKKKKKKKKKKIKKKKKKKKN